jgi:hypothetical protein
LAVLKKKKSVLHVMMNVPVVCRHGCLAYQDVAARHAYTNSVTVHTMVQNSEKIPAITTSGW